MSNVLEVIHSNQIKSINSEHIDKSLKFCSIYSKIICLLMFLYTYYLRLISLCVLFLVFNDSYKPKTTNEAFIILIILNLYIMIYKY